MEPNRQAAWKHDSPVLHGNLEKVAQQNKIVADGFWADFLKPRVPVLGQLPAANIGD